MMADRRILVTGAGGRLGRLLRLLWPAVAPRHLRATFLARADWDILSAQAPDLSGVDLVLDLAGVIRGDPGQNPDIAERVAALALRHRAALIYMSSAAVYPGGAGEMHEEGPIAPASDYGRSKLAAEDRVRAMCPMALVLRLGNVAGADALLGGLDDGVPARLDPVAGQPAGPVRSYIGPLTLARVMARLIALRLEGPMGATVVNLAQPGPVAMGDILDAAHHPWQFGPERPGVLPRMVLATHRLKGMIAVEKASPEGLVAEWRNMKGWP